MRKLDMIIELILLSNDYFSKNYRKKHKLKHLCKNGHEDNYKRLHK